MDSVRFGRALGIGARHAARSLLEAADAAAAPAPPRAPSAQPPVTAARRPSPPVVLPPTGHSRPVPPPQPRPSAQGIAEGGRRFGRAVLAPATRAGSILWLEFTGVFFGLFALVSALATWRLHTAWHLTADPSHQHGKLLIALTLTLLFGYFCASSFTRASRRSRRP